MRLTIYYCKQWRPGNEANYILLQARGENGGLGTRLTIYYCKQWRPGNEANYILLQAMEAWERG